MAGKRVLYVDDDDAWRDCLRPIIEANGYEMIEAGSREEGLLACLRGRPDVVIVDLMMEEVDSGLGLVRDLRAHDIHVPVYLLSSVGDMMSLNIDAESIGVWGVLQKPVKSATLLSLLQHHFDAVSR